MAEIFGNFFSDFCSAYHSSFFVEFESDRMSPRESAKNGRMGANCKIFVDSEVKVEIYDKNYPRKKIHVSMTLLKFS